MKKDQVDLLNAVVWIPESKTPNGVVEVPLTPLAVEAFRDQLALAGQGEYLFPSDLNPTGHRVGLKTVWSKTLRRESRSAPPCLPRPVLGPAETDKNRLG